MTAAGCGCGFDARGDWDSCSIHKLSADPSDELWLSSCWPVARAEHCTCYRADLLEYGPDYPCEHCVKQQNSSNEKGAA